MKKKIIIVFMVLMLIAGMSVLTGCSTDKAATGEETIVVGLDDTSAPMRFRDAEGNLVGFDIDLANAVGEYLGVKIEFKPITGMQKKWN